ncbi:MAG: LLM class F420-dependent oxidoreductase [Acidimicrobiia bacterium]|nr:LLM class F420-dependent oxidoreductase [Acidimicrobiia bacterium]MYG71590.1 LLM class F420-dependent oxidoreductase [Acidimicrobiia bacterium]
MGLDSAPHRVPRIGLCLPYEGSATAQDIVDVAQAAEAGGLDSVWVGDHVAFPVEFTSQNPTMADGKYPYPTDNPRLEALTTLAYVAGATSNIKLLVNACVLPQRNPVIVGKAVATLDFLSGGRVIFGVTLGWLREEFDALGADYGRRRQLLEDGIEILRTLWEQDQPSYEGETYSFLPLNMRPKPVQSPVPIFVGGHSRPALRRAAAMGDGWLASRMTPAILGDYVSFLREERKHSPRADQPFTVATTCPAAVGSHNPNVLDVTNQDATLSTLAALGEAGADLINMVVGSYDPAETREAAEALGQYCGPDC